MRDSQGVPGRRPRDLAGATFGRLTAVSYISNSRWLCRCVCGNETAVSANSLISAKTKSCGCWHREHAKFRDTIEHGHSRRRKETPTYKTWRNMTQRCSNPNANDYKSYGGRGIRVCDRWLGPTGFICFLHDVGERPSPGHSIDRFPDNDGNYEPGNVRWATLDQQLANRRKSISLQTATEVRALRERGESVKALMSRFGISKASVERILNGTAAVLRIYSALSATKGGGE